MRITRVNEQDSLSGNANSHRVLEYNTTQIRIFLLREFNQVVPVKIEKYFILLYLAVN